MKTYFESVAAEHGEAAGDVYSVLTQYGGSNGPGTYQVSFTPGSDVDLDTDAFPASGGAAEERCTDSAASVAGKCITDAQLQAEIAHRIATNGQGWAPSLHDIFFVFTPPGVGDCFEPGSDTEGDACAFSENGVGYCAYHSDFGPGGEQTLYANIPDNGNVTGCDSEEHPNGAGSVDATLDAASHEHSETVTDPLENEPGWRDVIGQEIGDKCLPPETFEIYGEAMGGSLAGGTAFNQLIAGHHYWLQTEWSNTAGEFQGGCVQRMVNAAFTVPASAAATVPASFDGSASGSAGDPVDYWVWDFGDGIQVGTPEATVTHTYALPGIYEVTLTAVDASGSSNTTTHTVAVGEAPVPPPPSPPTPSPSTATVTVTTPPPVTSPAPIHLGASELAAKLGLPPASGNLSGLGTIALGRAECPPACAVTLRLYTSVRVRHRHHRFVKQVLIGSLHTAVAAGGTGALALVLNPTGHALLSRARRLRVLLKASIEDQQGAAWQLSRPFTLTSSGGSTLRRRG